MIKISPSILSADFKKLSAEIGDILQGGADYVHVDVMDGIFVPNITIGIPVVRSLSEIENAVLDVHLMITKPHRYVEEFCRAGADILTVHLESDEPERLFECGRLIKEAGKRFGMSLKPKTPASALLPYIESLDLVLVMTVEPGFGGQSFMVDMLPKIAEVREMIEKYSPGCELAVDGGIDIKTAPLVKKAGANVLSAGSSVFNQSDRASAIRELRNA